MGTYFTSKDGNFACYSMRANKCKICTYLGEPVDELTIPSEIDGMKVIGIDSGFAKGMRLLQRIEITRLIISEGIERINSKALVDMLRLRTLILPSTLKVFGSLACYNTPSLKNINLEDTKIKDLKEYTFTESQIETLKLPETLESINGRVFYRCENIKNFHLGKNVKDFTADSINGLELEKLTVDNDNPYFTVLDDVMYTKDFKKLVYVPAGIKKKELLVHDGVTEIGKYAFYRNATLENIVFPESLKKVGEYAFYCASIPRLSFPAATTEFGSYSVCPNNVPSFTLIVRGRPDSMQGLYMWHTQHINVRSNSSVVKKWAEDRGYSFRPLSKLKQTIKDAS